MPIWKKADIENQLDLIELLQNARRYYKYKPGEEAEATFVKIDKDIVHETCLLLIMGDDWTKSYKKTHNKALNDIKRELYNDERYAVALKGIGFVKTLMS